MGTVSITGTTTAGQSSGTVASGTLDPFTGPFTVTISTTDPVPPTCTINWHVDFKHFAAGTSCWQGGASTVGGAHSTTVGETVGLPGFVWTCSDWDSVVLSISSALDTPLATWTLTLTGAGITPSYCAYGVESNPDVGLTSIITSAIIDAVVTIALAATGQVELIPFVDTALAAIEGMVFTVPSCDTLPEPIAPLDLSDSKGLHIEAMQQWFQNAVWHYFCQCTPAPTGGPTPVVPDPPVVSVPVSISPTIPAFGCDENDICTTLNTILHRLDSLTANVSYARRDIQIIQRQASAFAYIPGLLFSDLSGSGELSVSDILALSVESTTIPPTLSLISADPIEYRFLGRISLGTVDGWQRQVMLSHNPHLVLPIDGTITRIGYSLELGVIANVQTFKMEPLG